MFGIGGTELIIILVFGLLIFGPDKMPQMGRTIGRALRQFQRAQDDMTRVLKAELYSKDDDRGGGPLKMPDLEEFLTRKSDATKATQEAKAVKAAAKVAATEPAGYTSVTGAAETPTASLAASLYGLPVERVEPAVAEPPGDTEVDQAEDTVAAVATGTDGEEVGEE